MSRLIDLINKKFNRLLVIQRRQNDKWGQSMWLCKCDCGSEVTTTSHHLREGHTKSCGCLQREVMTKHGHSTTIKSNTYTSWDHMIQRCTNPNFKQYKDYGGRGIRVCKRWKEFKSFLEDMGKCPSGYSIDRIDNDKGYYKENCRWATRKQQMRNMRRNHLITYNGKTQCLIDWSEETGISYNTLRSRLRIGWSTEKALSTSTRKRRNNAIYSERKTR